MTREFTAERSSDSRAAWGHRKIWAMLRADGVRMNRSSVLRALARRDLLMPVRYQAERRQLAVARRALFAAAPTRRNRVWQTDLTEFETGRGGTWRVSPVLDYAIKVCLAPPVSSTTAARDAIAAIEAAIAEAERLLGHPLLEDFLDRHDRDRQRAGILEFGLPAFHRRPGRARSRPDPPSRAGDQWRGRTPQPDAQVRAPYRLEIADALELADEAEALRAIYSEIHPHETLDFERPIERET